MGKKNDTATPATASTEAPAPKKTTGSVPAAASPAATSGNGTKSAAARPAAKKKPAKAPPKKPVTFSNEDISLRAYFIAEHRHRHGIHGDEHSDWIEAERQLKAEHRKKTAKKVATSKKRA